MQFKSQEQMTCRAVQVPEYTMCTEEEITRCLVPADNRVLRYGETFGST